MRKSLLAVFTLLLCGAAVPAFADSMPVGDLTFVLDSTTVSGNATGSNADPDNCALTPNCALFTGTLTNTDNDASDSYPMFISSLGVVFDSIPANGGLTLDNTFGDNVAGLLSTDPEYATDNSGNPSDSYYGPIFGIDIAPGTTPGVYTGTVTITGSGGLGDESYAGFTVSDAFTVDVLAPEPSAAQLLLAGLLPFALWHGARRKWFSSALRR